MEPHAFTWHAQDPTGLVYARARYLDPQTGRFLTEDPVHAANLNVYARNNPVTSWDPYGLSEPVDYGVQSGGATGPIEAERRVAIRVVCQIYRAGAVVGSISVGFPAEGL